MLRTKKVQEKQVKTRHVMKRWMRVVRNHLPELMRAWHADTAWIKRSAYSR